jgi:quinol monooxygenase YgiN
LAWGRRSPFIRAPSNSHPRTVIVRLVRLTFAPQHLDDFLEMFERTAPLIRSQPGCEHLELLRDARYPNICATLSHWTGQEALDTYRQTGLFRETWSKTKTWFAAPPEATSYEPVTTVTLPDADANA